jgi:branched-chain amino acid aminotransferase
MEYINFNGKLIPADTPIVTADSRGLKFGDGLFETMRYRNGTIANWDRHMGRFFHGLQQLKFKADRHFTQQNILQQVLELVKKNNQSDARIRLNGFRENGGIFDPATLAPSYIIQSWQLAPDFGTFNENGLHIGIYPDVKKSCDMLSRLKHNNYLPALMAGFFAKEMKWNDAIILNQHGRICETTNANIFMVKENKIYTPALGEGPVAGTMRSLLFELLPQHDMDIRETEIDVNDLLNADELFITNALRPIRWVSNCGDKLYENHVVKNMQFMLTNHYPQYFKFQDEEQD